MSGPAFPVEMLGQHFAVIGKSGSGKTYAAKGLVEGLLELRRRVCILDPTGVWFGLRSTVDGRGPGYQVAIFGGAHADVAIRESSGEAVASIIATKNLPAIIDLSEMTMGERHRFATEFLSVLHRENRQPLHLIIDEADEFAPQNPMPETKRLLHQVDRIVRRGRVRGFRVGMLTQRPAVLHKNVLSQANTLVTMRLTSPQDRAALKSWIDGQGDVAQGKEVLQSIGGIPTGSGWVWAPELNFLQRVRFPANRTFDSSRTPDDDTPIEAPTNLAKVDLAGITASLESVEQAATSVKDLQAEVAKLRKQLDARQAGGGVPEAEVRRRIAEAVKAVPAIDPGLLARVDGELNRALTVVLRGAVAIEDTRRWLGLPVVTSVGADRRSEPQPQVAQVQRESAGAAAAPRRAVTADDVRATPAARVPKPVVPLVPGMTGPEQRILDAIAWLEALGVEEAEQPAVAFLAGYKYGGGAFNNPRGRLNQRGLVRYLPGHGIQLTDEGRALANHPVAAASNEELHERVLERLSGPEQRLLRPLLEAYPRSMSNAELAAAAGYTAGAGAFNNPRGRLRRLGLVDYPQAGHVVARDLLFPMGAR